LRRELDRNPLPERRASWEKLMFNATPPADLAESRRRLSEGIARFEGWLAETEWLAGSSFSLADINAFANFHSFPMGYPAEFNESATPRLIGWLRRCHARPTLREALAMGRGLIAQRAAEVRLMLGLVEEAAA
jgi:glutathione S-transferase